MQLWASRPKEGDVVNGKADREKLREAIALLLPKGRQFSSTDHLKEFVLASAGPWGFHVNTHGTTHLVGMSSYLEILKEKGDGFDFRIGYDSKQRHLDDKPNEGGIFAIRRLCFSRYHETSVQRFALALHWSLRACLRRLSLTRL
jgi:hypothetical protein